jgi:anaerobic selenocysteine-containing dehydrogenase
MTIGAAAPGSRVAYRTCPLCEATCGLEIAVDGDEVQRIRGDRADVFSRGFICPKGSTLKQLHRDPDRLRAPLIRHDDAHEAVTWEEAFEHVAARIRPIIAAHGADAVAVYLGNPNVHNMSGQIYNRVLVKMLGTRNVFSASTVDQMPRHVASGLVFGHPDLIPVPDIDRTDYLLLLGANPRVSNGSLATAPDWPGRMDAIRDRGGKVVVVDPRRSKTAEAADEHLYIRPGTDALWMAALANVLVAEQLGTPGPLVEHVAGLEAVAEAVSPFRPETVAERCGIAAPTTRRIARELAAAATSATYGRIGTHTTRHGTVAAWLVDVINVLTGSLDSPGGTMFPRAATERRRAGRVFRTGRWNSRVSGHPEVRGELPVAALAEEIETEGEGRIRALITVAGNPVLSTPDSDRLAAALARLDFMVSVDLYRNETTRHADVLLPPPSPLERAHYDFAFTTLSVRNVANYSEPVFARPPDQPDEWEILLGLAAAAAGLPGDQIATVDDQVLQTLVAGELGRAESPIAGRDAREVVELTAGNAGPDRILDFLLRVGPYGDGYGADPDGLSLERLRAHPHGIDLGPLRSRIPEVLATPSGKVELAPEALIAAAGDLADELAAPIPDLVLVGRRTLRSNNSWMHNLEVLVKGKEQCTLQINPSDAARLGVAAASRVRISSEVGSVTAPIEVTDAIMAGVVSLPHGWGHDEPGTALAVAQRRPGTNSNRLTPAVLDPLSGNATLNGIPVKVTPL